MIELARLFGATVGALLLGAGLLHLVAALGRPGRGLSAWLCRAPGLDLVVLYFTGVPPIAGAAMHGWSGLGVAVAGQIVGVLIWARLHEFAHPEARKGPRIVRTLAAIAGPWKNHFALWWTAWAVPVFLLVRVAEYLVYPPITWVLRMPKYRAAEWVNVSRHKFDGLVGYDMIWCLYCDWMTGVWSLGTEMLRNIESFWCPIRFSDEKKCANCRVDFPDVDGGWVPADGTMADVTAVIETQHGGPTFAWFGHPARLTIDGAAPAETPGNDATERDHA